MFDFSLNQIIWINAAACFYMTGVIWIIQTIHYPSFALISKNEFGNFHKKHTEALGLVVGPVMIVELITALILTKNFESLWILNLIGVMALFATTFLISVPAHNHLARGFDQQAWKKLVNTNWIRTGLWTFRSIFLIIFLFQYK